jgi:hypothetical protein
MRAMGAVLRAREAGLGLQVKSIGRALVTARLQTIITQA